MTIIKKLFPIITILALISITLLSVFQLENMLVKETTINGMKIYTFDLNTYLHNINNGWQTQSLDFSTIIPTRQFTQTTANMLSQEFWNTLFNNIALAFEWLYFPLNFVLYTIRWLAFIIQGILTIIGWPMKTIGTATLNGHISETPLYYSTLMTILSWIKANLVIPYF